MRRFLSISVLLLSGAVGACAPQYATPEQAAANACSALGPRALSGALVGGLGGAAGGAAIGSLAGGGRGAAIGAGAGLVAGLIVGAIAGHSMDQADCHAAQVALQRMDSAPVNSSVEWVNPQSGSHGTYTPVSANFELHGHVCRRIRADYFMHDHQPVFGDEGIVCRTPDGDWARVQGAAT